MGSTHSMLGNYAPFLSFADFFFFQVYRFPGPNCLQRLSAGNINRKKNLTCHLLKCFRSLLDKQCRSGYEQSGLSLHCLWSRRPILKKAPFSDALFQAYKCYHTL